MTTSASNPAWPEAAADALADAGYRRGGARQAVIDLLAQQDCALSAFEIERLLESDGRRRVARASVYRVLEELEQLKLVTRLEVGQGIARYEIADPSGHHHHHLVCDGCGEVVPFEDDELEAAIDRVAKRVTFAVAEHEITLRGACAKCRG